MNESLTLALPDALTCLTELQRDGTRPTQALERARELQTRHPGLRIDLLWEKEAYDESVHYDVLLRCPGEGTVTVAYASDRALPWPMRGAQRWSDGHLMRVNGRVVRVAQAVAALDFIWDQAPVTERLVNASLVREELEREPVTLTREDIQRAMDGFRRRRGLLTAETTLRWMRERGLTHEGLERMVAEDAEIAALRDRVVGERVEAYFAAHRATFDTARIARCIFPDEASACAALERLENGEMTLAALAQERFLAHPEASGELFATMTRESTPAALAEAVFAAAPGDVIGPIPMDDDAFAVAQVLTVEPARLDPATRRRIAGILFAGWLAERRATSTVEWNWGETDSAGKAA